jgi:threonine dehydrogenase-like Zn-dependent dehydrogenase
MRGIVLGPNGVQFRSDCPAATPAPGEVPVRVLMAGLCETDLQLARGYMNFRGILGHEFIGVPTAGPFAGERVAGEINVSCQACDDCRRGLSNHCRNRSVLGILNHDGAFAEVVCVPQANLHRIPAEVSTEQAVFVEPLAAAFQIAEQVPLRAGLTTIVLGDGRLGNLCAQVLSHAGCQVTVVGKHPRKLALLERLGMQVRTLDQIPQDRSTELVVDCTGHPTGMQTALSVVHPRGTIVLKTTVAGTQTLSLAPVVIDEITVVGSRCGPFPKAIEALRGGQVDVASLIDGIYPLEEAERVFERARSEPVLKLLFQVASTA